MAKVLTGRKGQVRINGNVVAFASGISVDYEYPLQRVSVLGQLEDADLAEVGHTARATVDHFMTVDSSFASTALELGFEQAIISSMRDQSYFDIEIFDNSNSNEIRLKLKDCKFAGGSGRMEVGGVFSGTWNFEALKVEHVSNGRTGI
jgi:hypothetical protein